MGTTKNALLRGDLAQGFSPVIQVWKLKARASREGSLGKSCGNSVLLQGHTDELWGLCTHPSQNRFLTCGHDRQLCLWDGEGQMYHFYDFYVAGTRRSSHIPAPTSCPVNGTTGFRNRISSLEHLMAKVILSKVACFSSSQDALCHFHPPLPVSTWVVCQSDQRTFYSSPLNIGSVGWGSTQRVS